jgi:hypothetical protein
MTHVEQINARRTKASTAWVIASIVVILIALLLIINGRKIYYRVQSWRSASIVEELEKDIEARRWESASSKLREGMISFQHEPSFLRVLSRFYEECLTDYSSASETLKKIILMKVAKSDDFIKYASLLVKSGNTKDAQKVYDEMPEPMRNSMDGLEVYADILNSNGRLNEGEKILFTAYNKDISNPKSQLRLAVLGLKSEGLDDARLPHINKLWEIAERKDRLGIEAISYLQRLTNTQTSFGSSMLLSVKSVNDARKLKQLSETHPLMTPTMRYEVLSTYLRFVPLEQNAIISAETEKQKGKPISAQFEFLNWLGQQREYQRILNAVSKKDALSDPNVFVIYMEALAVSENWDEILYVLKDKIPVNKAVGSYYAAKAYFESNNEIDNTRRMIASVVASANAFDFNTLLRSIPLAEGKGFYDLATEGCNRLIEMRPQTKVPMLEKILEYSINERNPEKIVSSLKRLVEARPSHADYNSSLAYYRLLTGTELELAWSQSVTKSEKIPQELLVALIALRQGQANVDFSSLADLPDPEKYRPGVRAVIAGFWSLLGLDVKAFRLGESINAYPLLDEERAALMKAIQN